MKNWIAVFVVNLLLFAIIAGQLPAMQLIEQVLSVLALVFIMGLAAYRIYRHDNTQGSNHKRSRARWQDIDENR